MTVRFMPSRGCGAVALPSNKSEVHRFLFLAAGADGVSTLRGVTLSDDVLASVDTLRALGVGIDVASDVLTVRGGAKPDFSLSDTFRRSASTLRFAIPVIAREGACEFPVSEALAARGLDGYGDALGVRYRDGRVHIGNRLLPGDYSLPAGVSSQFGSGLLLALAAYDAPSTVTYREAPPSAPYLAETVRAIRLFGKGAEAQELCYSVGSGRLSPVDLTVGHDVSAAVPFLVLNRLGCDFSLPDLPGDESVYADAACERLLDAIDRGDAVDLSDAPDLAPCLFAYAALTRGGRFCGTARLRKKESDRVAGMKQMLAAVGVSLVEEGDGVTVGCGVKAPREVLDPMDDHRLAFAASVILSRVGGKILVTECVEKSFPDFFAECKKSGLNIEF